MASLWEDFFKGAGTAAGSAETGTTNIATSEQQALLYTAIQDYLSGGGTQYQTIDTSQYALDTEDFITGTVDPILQEVQSSLVDLGNTYAGQRTGSGRSNASLSVIESGQEEIASALAEQSVAAQTNQLNAAIANQTAQLTAAGLDSEILSTLLNTSLVDSYALSTSGATTEAGLGTQLLQSLMRGSEGFWQGGASSIFSDARLKDDIRVIGKVKGIVIATWRWNVKPYTKGIGFIAQNVAGVLPDAVGKRDGFLTIDLSKIIKFITKPIHQ